MDVVVRNAPDRQRYEAWAGDRLAALADYLPTEELVAFTHTEVLAGFEGQGIASTLIRWALDDVRAQQLSVLPVCPFVRSFLDSHPEEYGDLLYRSRTGTVQD